MRSTCMPPSSAIKMATFNAKAFEKKLNAMDLSQTSIQTVSLWIIHHRQSIREIVAVWIEMMKKAKMDRKLALLYLANDVVQNSRKKSKELIVFFGKAFKDTFPYLNDKKINSQVERVLKIWDERRVYEKDFLEKLRSAHNSGKKEKAKSSDTAKALEKPPDKVVKPKTPVKPLPDDFKMSTVMNMIVSMKELESELSVQDKQMASLKVDDLETVKQVKDRSGVNKFVKEFEESKEKLDTYCNKLSRCINEKRVLIDMLHHSESYYDAAYEEAKVIVHAYKTFGSRLTSMKRKVESKVRKLKVQWQEKQKELEEQKNSNPEYELEPISDAEEPSEFQADNTDVLDMDLGSDSEVGTPDGPLYDPGSVMYDPNDAGKDFGDSSQQSKEDKEDSVSTKIDIPNPEDVFKNIVGQEEVSGSNLFKPMSIMLDGKLQTVSLSDGNMIVGSEDRKETSLVQMNPTSSMSSLSASTGVASSSLVAMEPSGNLLNNEAVSPISEDSVPSPEGTPEGLVLEKDDEIENSVLSLPDMQQSHNEISPVMASTDTLTVLQNNQFVMTGNDSWPIVVTTAPLQIVQNIGTISDLPPPPMMQSFSAVPTANLSFEPTVQSFIGDQGNLGPSFVQVQQSGGLMDQFHVGGAGMNIAQENLQAQLQMSNSIDQLSGGASTTPTQDESLESVVRPIDILTQLLNKGRKSRKDHQPSVEKDRTRSDHDKEHRSKDHGKHKKSSRRKSSDRHHSTDHKEASSDRSDSLHSSSKRSHHRRKSRGHSKEKHSSYADSKTDRKEGSVDGFDDSSIDSYLKSPKISRLQSSESLGDGEESKVRFGRGESGERSPSVSSDLLNDAVESRPVTIFDQRRNESQLNKDETVVTSNELLQNRSHQAIKQDSEGLQVGSDEAILNRQHSSGMGVFLQQQNSLEGQLPVKQADFQSSQQSLNPPVSLHNTDKWTSTASTPQKQMEFYFDSRRSPTPELNHYEADMPISQPQQPHLIPSHFQQAAGFGPSSLPQFNSHSGVLFSEASIAPQVSMAMGPTVSMEQNSSFPQGIPMQQQQQNIQVGGFEVQPMFNQHQFMQTERPFLHEPRMDTNETLVVPDQQGGMMLAGVDQRFKSVEPPPVSPMHFGTPDNPLQMAIRPSIQPPQSPFQQERPFFRGDGLMVPQERPFFTQAGPNIRHDRPLIFNEHASVRGEHPSPFAGKQDGFENEGGGFNQNFKTQHSREEIQLGESINTKQGNSKQFSERNSNHQQSDNRPLSSENPATRDSSLVYQDFNTHQENIADDQPYSSTTFNENRDNMNDPFQRKADELNGHYNHLDRDPIRPRFPQPNMHMRNRFRPPPGPNLSMRGSRPHRMFRPAGYQHQRPRFRPPMPRPRTPQGYMPRRPVF